MRAIDLLKSFECEIVLRDVKGYSLNVSLIDEMAHELFYLIDSTCLRT